MFLIFKKKVNSISLLELCFKRIWYLELFLYLTLVVLLIAEVGGEKKNQSYLVLSFGLLGGCYMKREKKGAMEQRFQLYCGRTASSSSHDDPLFVKDLFLVGLNYMEIKENH